MTTRRPPRLTLGAVVGAALLAVTAVHAGERRVTFTAGERGAALAHFLPELGRVVGEALARSGAEVDDVAGHVDELEGERVRLTVSARGHRVVEEGALEEIDAVARRVGERLAQAATPARVSATSSTTTAGKPVLASRAALLPTKPESAKPEARVEAKPEAAKAEPAKAEPAKSEPKGDPKVEAAAASTTPVSSTTPTPAGVVPVSVREPATPPVVTPPAPTATTPTATPSEPPARSSHDDEVPTRSTDPYQQAFVPRRVVVHQVAEIPTAYGAGYSATHALFTYLRTRLRLQVVPGGVGMAPLHIVTDEAARSAARAVVMARLLGVEPLGAPGAIRCRFELVIVRDGRVALRRVVDALPSDPTAAARRTQDPVYVAVAQALESLTAELDGVLAPIR